MARTFWDKIPEEVKEQFVFEALEQMELSLRELTSRITDMKEHFTSGFGLVIGFWLSMIWLPGLPIPLKTVHLDDFIKC